MLQVQLQLTQTQQADHGQASTTWCHEVAVAGSCHKTQHLSTMDLRLSCWTYVEDEGVDPAQHERHSGHADIICALLHMSLRIHMFSQVWTAYRSKSRQPFAQHARVIQISHCIMKCIISCTCEAADDSAHEGQHDSCLIWTTV